MTPRSTYPTIKIKNKLYQRLRKFRNSEQTRLYLLGADNKDVLTSIGKVLERTGGCEFLPGISHEELHAHYKRMLKRKLNPRGFVFLDTNIDIEELRNYDYKQGSTDELAKQLPKGSIIVFVNTIRDRLEFLITMGESGRLKEVKYEVVE